MNVVLNAIWIIYIFREDVRYISRQLENALVIQGAQCLPKENPQLSASTGFHASHDTNQGSRFARLEWNFCGQFLQFLIVSTVLTSQCDHQQVRGAGGFILLTFE